MNEEIDVCPLCQGNMDAETFLDGGVEVWQFQYCGRFERTIRWISREGANYEVLKEVVMKKCDPDLFEMILRGDKNVDIRLNDFKVKDGYVLRMVEFNRATQVFSGRSLERKIVRHYTIRPTVWFNIKDIEDKGFLVIELAHYESLIRCSKCNEIIITDLDGAYCSQCTLTVEQHEALLKEKNDRLLTIYKKIKVAHNEIELNKSAYVDTSCKNEHKEINDNLKELLSIIEKKS